MLASLNSLLRVGISLLLRTAAVMLLAQKLPTCNRPMLVATFLSPWQIRLDQAKPKQL